MSFTIARQLRLINSLRRSQIDEVNSKRKQDILFKNILKNTYIKNKNYQ
jgi:hypothetical protein